MSLNIDWTALGIELSDEQKAEFDKQAESEVDKARTQASETARKNAEKALKASQSAEIERIANEKAQKLLQALSQTEEEKIEAAKAELERDRQQLLHEKKETVISAKLKAAGYGDEQIKELTPVFTTGADIPSCEKAVDIMLGIANAQITSKVDAVKAELTNGGVASGINRGGTAPVMNEAKVLGSVYDQTKQADFVNSVAANRQLDLQAIMALDNMQSGT